MTDYHEPPENMSEQDRDFVRALRSLIEEIEAVDWYQQRIASSGDEELLTILSHNRNEEMEHACMTLEWLRRNMPGWDEKLRLYLERNDFTFVIISESIGRHVLIRAGIFRGNTPRPFQSASGDDFAPLISGRATA